MLSLGNVPFPFPRLAFIVRKRCAKPVAALFGVVVDHDPASILQHNGFEAGPGIWDVRVHGRRPRFAMVGRGADQYAIGRITAVPHIGHQCPILFSHERGLDGTPSHDRLAGTPIRTLIITDRHQADIVPIGIEGQQDSPGRQDRGVCTRHPARLAFCLVPGSLDNHGGILRRIFGPHVTL